MIDPQPSTPARSKSPPAVMDNKAETDGFSPDGINKTVVERAGLATGGCSSNLAAPSADVFQRYLQERRKMHSYRSDSTEDAFFAAEAD